MIQKVENCIYCNKKMESKTAKKRFCSDKCRVYYNRESGEANKQKNTNDTQRQIVQNLTKEQPTSNFHVNTTNNNEEILRKIAQYTNSMDSVVGEKYKSKYKKIIDNLKKQLK